MNRRQFLSAGTAASLSTLALRGLASPPATAQGTSIPRRNPAQVDNGSRVDPRRLQSLLDDVARSLGIVGAQLAVYDGDTVYEVATGYANLERRRPMSINTLFQVGSTTKVFNAALVMSLVDRGDLDLDEPVKTWITDLELTGVDTRKHPTLRQLLSMSAGLDNGPYTEHGRGDDAVARYVASLAEVPQIFEPGTAFGYSNAGSNVAGLAAQRATGVNWETLLSDHILQPLGLEYSVNFPEDLLFHSVALGYRRAPGEQPQRVSVWGLPRSMAPAGATLCCSAGDLVRFARMFLDDGKSADGRQVLSKSAVETMQTPQIDLPAKLIAQKWCPGPYWKVWGGQVVHGHSGTNTGGSSLLLWCPEKNVAAATIANVPNQGYPLADRVFDVVFPQMFGIEKPRSPKPDSVTPVDVDLGRYAGSFVALGSEFRFDIEDGKLVAKTAQLESELIPIGDDRFLPRDPAMGGNRGWDVAFWGDDEGRATHFLNGVFALRRAA